MKNRLDLWSSLGIVLVVVLTGLIAGGTVNVAASQGMVSALPGAIGPKIGFPNPIAAAASPSTSPVSVNPTAPAVGPTTSPVSVNPTGPAVGPTTSPVNRVDPAASPTPGGPTRAATPSISVTCTANVGECRTVTSCTTTVLYKDTPCFMYRNGNHYTLFSIYTQAAQTEDWTLNFLFEPLSSETSLDFYLPSNQVYTITNSYNLFVRREGTAEDIREFDPALLVIEYISPAELAQGYCNSRHGEENCSGNSANYRSAEEECTGNPFTCLYEVALFVEAEGASATPTLDETVTPSATSSPGTAVAPSATPSPSDTATPSATPSPSDTATPSATPLPGNTAAPAVTLAPSATPESTSVISGKHFVAIPIIDRGCTLSEDALKRLNFDPADGDASKYCWISGLIQFLNPADALGGTRHRPRSR